MPHSTQQPPTVLVCALYKFVSLPDYATLKPPLLKQMEALSVYGTLLLAEEGINGTIAGNQDAVNQLITWLEAQPGLGQLETKLSWSHNTPFKRSKVKLKKEIVTMGVTGLDPERSQDCYVEPEQWNALIDDPDVLLIDTRNQYEVEVGTFRGAINPGTDSFREFPAFVDDQLDPTQHRKVAMFCTGGIRCEKSTAYLKQQGFESVYHLRGGILKYLEQVPREDSRWQGECFVFDDRVTVDQDLNEGSYIQCHACRRPLSDQDTCHPHYQVGESCSFCYGSKTESDRQRYRERERQMQLAEKRGQPHMGREAMGSAEKFKD